MADAKEEKKEDKKEEKSSSGRWWEFYLVRYALGTVFGVLIVNMLAKSGLAIPFPEGSIAEISKPEGLPLLLGYGLAYCYLASAPILVFHATRFSMNYKIVRITTIVFMVAAAFLGIAWAARASTKISSPFLYVSTSLAIGIVSFLFLLQMRAIHYGTKRSSDMWKFYLKLDKNRRAKENRELIDSYRHLREHGNAFFVVLMELLLGMCLFVAGKVSILTYKELKVCDVKDIACSPETPIIQTVILILAWIIPAAVVWSIGCHLESEFANDTSITQSS